MSLIEWEGGLEPGKIPAGARRLARAGVMVYPGQKGTMWHCGPEEVLKRGVGLTLEPNVGANNELVDLRVDFEAAGLRPASLAAGLTVMHGKPVVVPLGEVDGKKLGVVVECRVTGAAGD